MARRTLHIHADYIEQEVQNGNIQPLGRIVEPPNQVGTLLLGHVRVVRLHGQAQVPQDALTGAKLIC